MDDQPSFFNTGSVVWDLKSSDKYDAIREIVYRSPLFKSLPNLDLDDFAQRVVERERIQSTGFGHGVAIAHGRTYQVDGSHVCLGVSRKGIDFNAVDGDPVYLLFIVANHPDLQTDYLTVLSTLVSIVRNKTMRGELLACISGEELELKLLSAIEKIFEKSRNKKRESAAGKAG